MLDNLANFSKSMVGQVHVRSSVLNPLLWLSASCGLLFLTAAYFIPQYTGFLIVCAFIPVAFALVAYAYFAFKSPDRLQSEEFQEKMHQFQMMQGIKNALVLTDEKISPNPVLSHIREDSERE